MPDIYDITTVCPVCRGELLVTRLQCAHCGSALEGAFRALPPGASPARREPTQRELETRFGRLARLDRAQLEFVEAFVRCKGVIKNVEDMLGISYPTVKARLANALEAMGYGADGEIAGADQRRARREILAELAAGRISTEEAHRLLREQDRAAGDEADDAGG